MTQVVKKRITVGGVFILVILLILSFAYFLPGVFANEDEGTQNISDITENAQPQESVGTISGGGKYFEVKNSSFLNIALESTKEIKAEVESVPQTIVIRLKKVNEEDENTQLTIYHLEPNTLYHLYIDDYHNYRELLSNNEGVTVFEIDLLAPHILFIQTKKSTKFIRNDATGGDCSVIGTWNNSTKTCTLNTNLNETIQIDSDSITLDGNGYKITGSNTGNGIYLPQRKYVTIKNLNIENFSYGIYLKENSQYNSIKNNTINSKAKAIYFESLTYNNIITNNTINLNSYSTVGIYIGSSSSNNNASNNILNLNYYDSVGIYYDNANYSSIENNQLKLAGINTAIQVKVSNGNNLRGNIIYSTLGGKYGKGIYLYRVSDGLLEDNEITNLEYGIYLSADYTNQKDIIRKNILKLNKYGIYLSATINSQIYNNDFLDNTTHSFVAGGSGNVFNLPKPTGGNYWSNWITPDNDGDGFVDNPFIFSGGQDNLPSVCPFKSDFTPPVTVANLTGEMGNNGWYKSDVTVELQADDSSGFCKFSSGVAKTQYSFDKVNWIDYSGPFVVSNSGEKKVYYRSIDNSGNIEDLGEGEEGIIFLDNFTEPDGLASNWTVHSGNWTIENQEYSVSGSNNQLSVTSAGDINWRNYKASIRVFPINPYWQAGLRIRYNPFTQDGYEVQSSYYNQINFLKWQGGVVRKSVAFGVPTPVGQWHTLGIEARDNLINVYVNEQLKYTFTDDSPIKSGKILLFSAGNNYYTHFDDLLVSGLSINYNLASIKIDKSFPEVSSSFDGTMGANDWYVSDVTATLSATDDVGISKIEYSLDGQNWETYSDSLVLNYSGEKTFYYRATDFAGNIKEESKVIKIDKNPPLTLISLEGEKGNKGWYKSNVEVTLAAQDEEGGLGDNPIEYSFDGEHWNTYNGPFTISEEGEKTIYYHSQDLAGNIEQIKQTIVKIDKTAPEINYLLTPEPNQNGWNNTDVTVRFECSDNLSGIESCSPDIVISTEGKNQSVTGTAVDQAGNVSMVFVENINIDKTAPIINGYPTTQPNENGWYNSDVSVAFACYDELSGVDYCSSEKLISKEGVNQNVDGLARDKAGNLASTNVSGINIDKTAPETEDDYIYDGIWTNTTAVISLLAKDQDLLSGLENTKYCIDSEGVCNPQEGNDYQNPITIEEEGTFYLRYQSKDRAGNVEEINQVKVMIDKSAPSASIEVKDARDDKCSFFFQLWIDNGQVSYDVVHGCSEISANIDASISGLKSYKLTIKDSNGNIVREADNQSIFFNFENQESVYTLILEAYDNAGNFAVVSRTVYEDDDNDVAILNANGGAPDLLDLCPAQIPSQDLNKDGCQDIEGVNVESLNWCIDVYTGRATTSLYPTTSLTQIGESFFKKHKNWYEMNSKIDNGIETNYAMNIVDRQGSNRDEIHCSIDAENIKLSSGEELIYTRKDNAKIVYKEIFGRTIVKEKYHAHELSDGAKIFATMRYDEKKDTSNLHLVFSNPEKTFSCTKEVDKERDICQESCGKRNIICHKLCNEKAVQDKINCVKENNYQIKEVYDGYRTLSLFDILKLVGYED